MPIEIVTSSENVDIGAKLETTSGTLEQAVYDAFETQGAELAYPTEEATDSTVGDHGGVKSRVTTSRGGDATLPATLGYKRCDFLLSAPLRDSWATEVTIVGTADIDLVTNGTHQDGATGIQIQAATGAFNDLITYGPATTNGARGLTFLNSGWVNGGNNQPMAVKAVWHDATARAGAGQDNIDVYNGFGGGVASDLFGAPKTAEAGSSPTMRFGSAVRNRQTGAGARATYSILIDYFQHQTAARFNALRGWTANDLTLAMSAKGEVTITANGNGRGWTPLQAAPPTGQAAGSHFDFTGLTTNSMMISGDHLQFLAAVTEANADNPAEVPIVLSDMNVSALNLNIAGGVAVIGDIMGTDENLPRSGGMHNPTGNFNWYQTDDVVAERITKLGARTTNQNAFLTTGFRDPQDQWVIFNFFRCNFQQSGPSPGRAGNAVSGTMNFGAIALSRDAGSLAVQQIAAV